MKLVGYVRVSTNGQAENGLGLEVQERAIRDWAKAQSHQLVSVYRDEGVSGTTPAHQRPALREALGAIQDGAAEGLVAARLDRLARALHEQEAILAQCWKHGGIVYMADVGEVKKDDPDDPARTAIRQMLGVFAQLDRSTLVKRMRDGRRQKAEKGGYAYGAPPLGYKAEGGALVPDEEEQAAVALIASMHADGASTRAIADALTTAGLKTKQGKTTWHSATVARTIQRLKKGTP